MMQPPSKRNDKWWARLNLPNVSVPDSPEFRRAAAMARYRKIDAGIWGDEKFRALSHPSKLVYFFLFTHPHMTMLGAMRATLPGLAAELGMRRKLFVHAFSEIVANGFAKHDEGASFFWFPDSLKS